MYGVNLGDGKSWVRGSDMLAPCASLFLNRLVSSQALVNERVWEQRGSCFSTLLSVRKCSYINCIVPNLRVSNERGANESNPTHSTPIARSTSPYSQSQPHFLSPKFIPTLPPPFHIQPLFPNTQISKPILLSTHRPLQYALYSTLRIHSYIEPSLAVAFHRFYPTFTYF